MVRALAIRGRGSALPLEKEDIDSLLRKLERLGAAQGAVQDLDPLSARHGSRPGDFGSRFCPAPRVGISSLTVMNL
jgi:hypothetical protein